MDWQWRDSSRFHDPLPEPDLTHQDSALLVIDMQFIDAHPDFGLGLQLKQEGRFAEMAYYFEQVADIIPRIRQLQNICRAREIEVVHIGVCSLTQDGRDISPLHKHKGLSYAPGSKEVQFLPELAPIGDEIVINKTSSGVFNSTNIDQILKNLGIKNLIVTGVDTCYCVETAVRDAGDRGYNVILVGDGCATSSQDMQERALLILDNDYCVVRTTEEVLKNIGRTEFPADGGERKLKEARARMGSE